MRAGTTQHGLPRARAQVDDYPLVAGDHITVEAWQNSGGNLAYSVGKDTMSVHAFYVGS